MNKILFQLIGLALFLTLSSCDYYNFDEIQPIDAVPADLAITDAQSAAAARAGVYDELQSADLAFDGFLASSLYFSDDCEWTGTFPTRAQFSNFNVLPSNGTMAAVWNEYYDAINVANNVITILPNVNDISLTDALRNTFIGEARLARAICYFQLTQGWTEVPLVLSPTITVGEELFVPKNSQDEVFRQIIDDATFASQNIGAASLGMTAEAAQALLARVYMIQGQYGPAQTAALAAIGADYDATTDEYLDDELFYLNFIPTDGNSIAFFFGTDALNGRYSIAPRQQLIDAFEPGDLRFAASIDTSGGQRIGIKYNDFGAAAGSQSDPLLLFRKAEMVLVLAETFARDADFVTGSSWINQIRNRAGLPDVTLTAGNFEDLILQERYVELAMEGGHRLWDLRRTGRAQAVLGGLGYEACDNVWPLPQQDIDRNPNLVQNACCNC